MTKDMCKKPFYKLLFVIMPIPNRCKTIEQCNKEVLESSGILGFRVLLQ